MLVFAVDVEWHSGVYLLFAHFMELILRPNCCLLDLHSNDMNSLKRFFLTKSYSSINITLIQQHHLIKNLIK